MRQGRTGNNLRILRAALNRRWNSDHSVQNKQRSAPLPYVSQDSHSCSDGYLRRLSSVRPPRARKAKVVGSGVCMEEKSEPELQPQLASRTEKSSMFT